MDWIRTLLDNEANIAIGLLVAVINLAAAFGLDLSGEQTAAVSSVLIAVGAVLSRRYVWSTDSLEREVAGINHP